MFKDRKEAGQLLAKKFSSYKKKKDTFVLAIPRGGVVVAYEIAKQLNLPLDVVVIKKIGYPGNEELALGATGLDSYYLNEELARGVSQEYIQGQVNKKQQEVKKRYDFFRGKKPMYSVKNKTILLIDDGIATGATITMAIQIIKKQSPKRILVAIPVAPPDIIKRLEKIADEVVCLEQPRYFISIGEFYKDFLTVEDEEARELLQEKGYKD